MDFTVVQQDIVLDTVFCTIATGEVLEAGDLVEWSSGLPIKATASGAKIAYCPIASASGDVQVELSRGNNFTLQGVADAVFAVTQKGAEVDLVVTSTVQLVDVGSSSTNVFIQDISENAGTVGSVDDVRVKINLPIF